MFRLNGEHKSKGQSLVELALILPFMMVFFVLAADFGRAMTAYIQIGSAAREGAAYGMQSTDAAQDELKIEEAVLAESPSIWGAQPEVDSRTKADGMERPGSSASPYEAVEVTVTYDFQPIIPYWFVPSSIPMERTVEMRVVN